MEARDSISKSEKKRQMHALQNMGEQLVALTPAELAKIELPETLLDALLIAKRVTAHEGRRRQMQYIGKLMRDVDIAPIAEALAAISAPKHREAAVFRETERWREELLTGGEVAQSRFARQFPKVEMEPLAELVAQAKLEQAEGRPPRAFRQLFQALNQIVRDSK